MEGEVGDRLLRGLGLGGRIRVVAAVTTETVEELRRIHDPSPEVTAALGRTATGALLLAALLEKVTGREPMLTLEIEGNGPAGRIVATASPAGWVRALVANPHATAPPHPDGKLHVAGVVGTSGHLIVTRDPGIGEPYRGVVPIHTGEIATDLAHYLLDSEQLPAAVVLGVLTLPAGRVGHSAGYLLQVLPGVSDSEADALTERVKALGAVTARLSQGEGPEAWLRHLFPEGYAVLDEVPTHFHCGCSMNRVEAALKLLGTKEVQAILADSASKGADLTCEFCHRIFTVSEKRLEELLRELEDEVRALN
jgi:molecular chaperone Hsp33